MHETQAIGDLRPAPQALAKVSHPNIVQVYDSGDRGV